MMKIAIGGKGGTGKTTLTALLALAFRDEGREVIAVDADPDANLASTLGYPRPEEIVPIVEMKELIEERTGAKPGGVGAYFKLNPRVDDVPDRFVTPHRGIKILVMGRVRKPVSGCLCPENTFLKELTSHLILHRDEVLIMDMEAGVEHLGRGTAKSMDAFLVMVEPSRQSLESGRRIIDLVKQMGIPKVMAIINKADSKKAAEFVAAGLPGVELAGSIPYSEKIRQASLGQLDIEAAGKELSPVILKIRQSLGKSGGEVSNGKR